LKVRISGEWSHFSFHMERTIDVPSIIGLLNHYYWFQTSIKCTRK
jgi:hypothetical protein